MQAVVGATKTRCVNPFSPAVQAEESLGVFIEALLNISNSIKKATTEQLFKELYLLTMFTK
jgi:hypothetical protein